MSFRDSHRQLTYQNPKSFSIWEVRIACTPDGVSKAVQISPDGLRVSSHTGIWRDSSPLPRVVFHVHPKKIPDILGKTESLIHQIPAFIADPEAQKPVRLADLLP